MRKYYYMNGKRKVTHLKQNDPNNVIYDRQRANRAKIRAQKRKIRRLKVLTVVSISSIILTSIIILLNF